MVNVTDFVITVNSCSTANSSKHIPKTVRRNHYENIKTKKKHIAHAHKEYFYIGIMEKKVETTLL